MAKLKHRPIPELTAKEIERFWGYVDKAPGQGPQGECWEWKRGRTARGYGSFRLPRYNVLASRVSYFLSAKEDPGGLNVLHTCDNPPCCRDTHLFKGTQQDNVRDRDSKGRTAHLYGEAQSSAKLTEAVVRAIFADGACMSQRAVARKYKASHGICRSTVRFILKGKSWAHLCLVRAAT